MSILNEFQFEWNSKQLSKIWFLWTFPNASFSSAGLELIARMIIWLNLWDFSRCIKVLFIDDASILPLSKLKTWHSWVCNLEWLNSSICSVIPGRNDANKEKLMWEIAMISRTKFGTSQSRRESIEIIENTKLNDDSADSIRGYLMAMINAEIV